MESEQLRSIAPLEFNGKQLYIPYWLHFAFFDLRILMPTLTIKNVPPDLHERLKQSALENRRSINSEAIVCLERALSVRRIDPEVVLARIKALQEQAPLPWLTDEFLRRAKEEGRP